VSDVKQLPESNTTSAVVIDQYVNPASTLSVVAWKVPSIPVVVSPFKSPHIPTLLNVSPLPEVVTPSVIRVPSAGPVVTSDPWSGFVHENSNRSILSGYVSVAPWITGKARANRIDRRILIFN